MRPSSSASWDALHSRLQEASEEFGLPVAWPAEDFTPSYADGRLVPYLRPAVLPSSTPTHLYQVSSVHSTGGGQLVAIRDLERVSSYFSEGTVLQVEDGTKIRIARRPWIEAPLEREGEVIVPLRIQWTSYR